MDYIRNKNLYTNMVIGFIGIILTTLGTAMLLFIPETQNTYTAFMSFLGISLTVHYIYALERKAGVSNRIIWFRTIIIIVTIIILSTILFR